MNKTDTTFGTVTRTTSGTTIYASGETLRDAWSSECLIRAGYPNHPAIRSTAH